MNESREGRCTQLLRVFATERNGRDRVGSKQFLDLTSWAIPWLRRTTPWPQFMLAVDRMDLSWEACEHLVIVCKAARAPFVGQSEEQARAWCCRVLQNYVASELRKERRRHSKMKAASEPQEGAAAALLPELDTAVVRRAISLLEREIAAQTRSNCVASVLRCFQTFVEHRCGMSPLNALVDKNPTAQPRRNLTLVYQWRRRGKLAAQKAYDRLRQQDMDPSVEAFITQLVLEKPIPEPLTSPERRLRSSAGSAVAPEYPASSVA